MEMQMNLKNFNDQGYKYVLGANAKILKIELVIGGILSLFWFFLSGHFEFVDYDAHFWFGLLMYFLTFFSIYLLASIKFYLVSLVSVTEIWIDSASKKDDLVEKENTECNKEWICPKCGVKVSSVQSTCMNCGTKRG